MSSTDDPKNAVGTTSHEEKEMHRVFEVLCDYQQKTKIKEEMGDITAHLEDVHKSTTQMEEGSRLALSIEASENRFAELTDLLQEIESKPNKKVSCNDVVEMYKFLKFKVARKDVEEMIWEVDENLDDCVDWNEFKLMFHRNITDKTGLEPNRFFNLVQFLIYDTNGNGFVSVDETMNLLYARYGGPTMVLKLNEIFGKDMAETGRPLKGINFATFLKAVETVQMGSFLGTTKGKIAQKRGFGKTLKKEDSNSRGH